MSGRMIREWLWDSLQRHAVDAAPRSRSIHTYMHSSTVAGAGRPLSARGLCPIHCTVQH